MNRLEIIKTTHQRQHLLLILLVQFLLLVGCTATIPVEEREPTRQNINQAAEKIISELAKEHEEFQADFDSAKGYFYANIGDLKIPIMGVAKGEGLLYNKNKSVRTYMDIKQLDIGIGLGAGRYQLLLLFKNQAAIDSFMDDFKGNNWEGSLTPKAETGTKKSTRIETDRDSVVGYFVREKGIAISLSSQLFSLEVNDELTDTGVSSVNIPNINFTKADRQTVNAPRKWDHALPFLAQDVIDLGYDLPLPYALSLTYADVTQDIILDTLDVGINGAEEAPFIFVDFQNASASNQTVQLKVETWLFPFMNIYAMLGKVEGDAQMDIYLDGNQMLEHMSKDCSGLFPGPLCNLLEDKVFLLPIDTPFSGKTYSLGTVLAGGWEDYFVTIPVNWTYADMDNTNTNGISTTITPRAGRVFNLNEFGNLAIFVGGNYLKADFTVSGSVATPDGLMTIDYSVGQSNADRWNTLVGGNWDIDKHWSWHMEYNGFTGSREAFITSLTFRY